MKLPNGKTPTILGLGHQRGVRLDTRLLESRNIIWTCFGRKVLKPWITKDQKKETKNDVKRTYKSYVSTILR